MKNIVEVILSGYTFWAVWAIAVVLILKAMIRGGKGNLALYFCACFANST